MGQRRRSHPGLGRPRVQHRLWIRGEYPHEGFYDDLTSNIHTLFDDVCVLPNLHIRVGFVLYPNEVEALHGLGELLDPLINELDDTNDAQYLNHPQWPNITTKALPAYEALRSNDNA